MRYTSVKQLPPHLKRVHKRGMKAIREQRERDEAERAKLKDKEKDDD
jgi:hypothetical protein